MRAQHLVLAICALIALGLPITWAQTNRFCNLVWSDEFNGNSINASKWAHEVNCWGGGNNELQCYTNRRENSFVLNGNLVIRAIPERYTGTQAGCTHNTGCTGTRDFTSARLRTINAPGGSWLYGRFEIRAKLPKGSHLWPAIWMLPTQPRFGTWAASGEIDIMEYRGNFPNRVEGTLHYGAQWPQNRHRGSGPRTFPFEFSSDFHIFSYEWERNEMRWYVDGTLYHTQRTNISWFEGSNPRDNPYTAPGQPWTEPFHLLLNLAVGGGFFNGLPPLTSNDVQRWTSSELIVDYVRVYQEGPCRSTPNTPSDVPQSSENIPNETTEDPIESSSDPSIDDALDNSAQLKGEDYSILANPATYGIATGVLVLIVLGTVATVLLVRKFRQNDLVASVELQTQ